MKKRLHFFSTNLRGNLWIIACSVIEIYFPAGFIFKGILKDKCREQVNYRPGNLFQLLLRRTMPVYGKLKNPFLFEG